MQLFFARSIHVGARLRPLQPPVPLLVARSVERVKDLKYENASTLLWMDGGRPNFGTLPFYNYPR